MARHLAGIPVETFHQSTPSNSWIITHNYGDLDKYAVVEVVNVDGEKMLPLRIYHSPDFNVTTITWTSNRAGYARIVGLPRDAFTPGDTKYGDSSENGGQQYFSWISFNGSNATANPDIVTPAATGSFSSTFTFDTVNDRLHSDGATPAVWKQSYVFEDDAPFWDRYVQIRFTAEPNGGVVGALVGLKDTLNNGIQLRAVEGSGTYTFVVEQLVEGVATVLLTSSDVGAWSGAKEVVFTNSGSSATFTFNAVAAGTFGSVLPLENIRNPITVFAEAEDDEFIYGLEVKGE